MVNFFNGILYYYLSLVIVYRWKYLLPPQARLHQYDALVLSTEQEGTVVQIFENIFREHHNPISKRSQNILLAQIELMLAYIEQFYHKQFHGQKKKTNYNILPRLEFLINEYLKDNQLVKKGIPTIRYIYIRRITYIARWFKSSSPDPCRPKRKKISYAIIYKNPSAKIDCI